MTLSCLVLLFQIPLRKCLLHNTAKWVYPASRSDIVRNKPATYGLPVIGFDVVHTGHRVVISLYTEILPPRGT